MSDTGAMADVDLDELLRCEHRVWEALRTGDRAADAELLADDFVGLTPTGFAGRDDHAGALGAGPTVAWYEIDDARLVPVAPDAALVCYLARYRRTAAAEPESMYVSSLWCRRDGRWVNTFSQDTPKGAAVP